MIGPTTDQRIIIPHAPRWELTGGAHTDGQEIVLPTIGATATVWLPLRGRVARLTWQLTRVWTSPDWANRQVTRQATYWDASRTRQVEPTTPASGRVNTPDPPGWGTSIEWELSPGGGVHWLRLRVLVSATYGVPGTRFIPSPTDLTEIIYM